LVGWSFGLIWGDVDAGQVGRGVVMVALASGCGVGAVRPFVAGVDWPLVVGTGHDGLQFWNFCHQPEARERQKFKKFVKLI
jgi:hypothetical protein